MRLSLILALTALLGCTEEPTRYPQPVAPQGNAGGALPPGQTAQPYGASSPPATWPAPPQPTGTPSQPQPTLPVSSTPDPISTVDMGWIRSRALELHRELVSTLPDSARQRVAKIPLMFDPQPGEVNAYAACADTGPILVVTEELLRIAAELSRARAVDERYGTQKGAEYSALLAQSLRPNQQLSPPPAGFYTQAQVADGSLLPRQHRVFDEMVAFVVSHELAHHYLGHLPCSAGDLRSVSEVANLATGVIPPLNQPNELAADSYGVQALLRSTSAHPQEPWTEVGALALMSFFQIIESRSQFEILFAFQATHPPATLRAPLIQQVANQVRSGWFTLPVLP